MKVLLVGNYVPDGQISMKIFAHLMQQELESCGHSVRLIRPHPILNRFGALPEHRAKWLGYIDKMVLFGPTLKTHARWADVVHICDHSNAYYTRHLQNVPHLITCHDVLAIRSALGEVPENPTSRTGQILQKIIVRGLQKAQQIGCVSRATQQQLVRVAHLDPERVFLANSTLNYPYSPLSYEEAAPQILELLRRKNYDVEAIWGQNWSSPPGLSFLLHVGGNQWYKNRMGVLEIYRNLRGIRPVPPLLLMGSPFTPEMHGFIADHGLTSAVVEVAGCSNEELRSLYSLAKALIFPSLAEGFGWPVIEAQACGCPVFVSNRSPMTEIAGESGHFFDPTLPKAAAHLIAGHLDLTESQMESQVAAGLENVSRFSPQAMVDCYLQGYERARAEIAARKR